MRKPTGRRVALASAIALLLLIPVVLWTTWPHIRFLPDFNILGRNEQGYSEYRHRQTGIVFVSLPGGAFLMGSPDSEEGRHHWEGPVHEVTLSPFMIGKYEVTQGQWKRIMGSNPSRFDGRRDYAGAPVNPPIDRATLPVEQVTWDDIQDFEAATGLGLPTEAQWEYACRAGTTGQFAGTGNLDDMGWYRDNSVGMTHLVGRKQSNQFGLHDMHGNVSESCEDVFDHRFYSKDVSGYDPLSTESSEVLLPIRGGSEYRVGRGGGWSNDARHCRSASRSSFTPHLSSGFRPAVPTP